MKKILGVVLTLIFILFVAQAGAGAQSAPLLAERHLSQHSVCIVHRGHNGTYDDNTWQAWKMIKLVFPGVHVEGDMRVAHDGTLWLYHDFTLKSSTTGTGAVEDHTAAYLSNVTYLVHGNHLTKFYDGAKYGPHEFIELKDPHNGEVNPWTPAIFRHIRATLLKLNATGRVTLYGFDAKVLRIAHATEPNLKLAFGSQVAYPDPSFIAKFGLASKILYTAIDSHVVDVYNGTTGPAAPHGLAVVSSQMGGTWTRARQDAIAKLVGPSGGYIVSHPKDC